MSNLNEYAGFTSATDSQEGNGRRKEFIIWLLVVATIVGGCALVYYQTDWFGRQDDVVAIDSEPPVCHPDECSYAIDPEMPLPTKCPPDTCSYNDPRENTMPDVPPTMPCTGHPDVVENECFPIPVKVTPSLNAADQEKIDALNAVVEAQPTTAGKLNHLFLHYCESWSTEKDFDYSYPSNYDLPPSVDKYNDSPEDTLAETLYEQFRKDLIAVDQSTSTLTGLPSSFDTAVNRFC